MRTLSNITHSERAKYYFFLVVVFVFSLSGCTNTAKHSFDFAINNQKTSSIDEIWGTPDTQNANEVTSVTEGKKVSFKYLCSEGSVSQFNSKMMWDFGDGNISEKANVVYHSYDKIGLFEVELCIDKYGCIGKYIYVSPKEIEEKQEEELIASNPVETILTEEEEFQEPETSYGITNTNSTQGTNHVQTYSTSFSKKDILQNTTVRVDAVPITNKKLGNNVEPPEKKLLEKHFQNLKQGGFNDPFDRTSNDFKKKQN